MHFIQAFGILSVVWLHFVSGTNSSNSTNAIPKQLAAVAAQRNSIPSDYFRFFDSYYKFHNSPTTWAEARRICEAEGAYLTIVNSEDEAYFLVRLFSQYPVYSLSDTTCNQNYFFIGFHDIFQEGEYVTIAGNTIRGSGYVHWAPGEPNNSGGPENCGSFYRFGGLNDLPCSCRGPFVCEISLDACSD